MKEREKIGKREENGGYHGRHVYNDGILPLTMVVGGGMAVAMIVRVWVMEKVGERDIRERGWKVSCRVFLWVSKYALLQ